MQVNLLRPALQQPVFRTPARPAISPTFIDGAPKPAADPTGVFFGKLLNNLTGSLPPASSPADLQPSPLGGPPQVDKLGTQVRNYRDTLNAVRSDLVTQLKAADEALKQAHQNGDHNAITAAQSAIDDLNTQIKANLQSLATIHDDVEALRDLRQQLSADIASGNWNDVQLDRHAIAHQRHQLIADIQA
jgi:hypothetical protein